MSLTIQQYKEILTVALDHQLAELKGALVFDDFDPAIEGDKLQRARVERLVKRKDAGKLEKMLQHFIEKFSMKDERNFAAILFEKTGLEIDLVPGRQLIVSTSRNLRVGMSGKGDHSLTFVSIELPTGSGSIYCIRGLHKNVEADWLDDHTIEIQIPLKREELKRINTVKVYNETIDILYKEE